MSFSINLLPWRERAQQERKNRFLIKLGLTGAVAVALTAGVRGIYDAELEQHMARNQRLEQEISKLNKQLKEFSAKELERDNLEIRLKLVNALQAQRNNATLLFNTLPQVIPEGVLLDRVAMQKGRVTLTGRSRNHGLLANFLAHLEQHVGANNIQIHSITNNATLAGLAAQKFSATFQLVDYVSPDLPEEKKHGR